MNFLAFWSDSPLSADEHHGPGWGHKTRLVDAVAFLFLVDYRADKEGHILIRSAAAQQVPQVVVLFAEQAGSQLPVGGQTDARTEAAKGLRDRRDQPDLARSAVGKAVFPRGFAPLVRNLLELPGRVDAPVNRRCGDDQASRPVAVGVKRHEFDKAHDEAALAGKGGKGFDFVVVQPAYENRVHLRRAQRRILRRRYTLHHHVERFRARNALEFHGVERVKADVNALQAGFHEAVAPLGQQVAVRGHGNVAHAQRAQSRDVAFHPVANQRLPARYADLADTQGDENASEPVQLRPGKNLAFVMAVFRIR